jgi:hypothetical protein
MKELYIDPTRTEVPETGIYVRAKSLLGKWDSVDIAHLTQQSLLDWLRSRGGDNLWAENTVLLLLGHPTVERPHQAIMPEGE